jgi:hypothetical protein
MSTARVANIELNIEPPPDKVKAGQINVSRPPSGRVPSANSTKLRSNSARGARPVLHEPCSSTLGKFHDGVNYSMLNDSSAVYRRGSNTPRSNHPILEAKQKFKYMTKQKSFVDESLFGGNTTSRMHMPTNGDTDFYQSSGNHVSHDIMSNMAPLQIRAGLQSNRSNLNSARADSARSIKQDELSKRTKENSTPYELKYQSDKPKPWRP